MHFPEAPQKKVDPATLYVIQPQSPTRQIGQGRAASQENKGRGKFFTNLKIYV
jgi:hypothetical protein